MQAAFAHVLMLVFAAAIARLGWFITRNSEQASRFFTLGAEPVFGKRFAVIWTKAIGWVFTVVGCFGVALYSVLIPLDLFRAR
jgi:cytochrome b561